MKKITALLILFWYIEQFYDIITQYIKQNEQKWIKKRY
jgi:hypothetical protein